MWKKFLRPVDMSSTTEDYLAGQLSGLIAIAQISVANLPAVRRKVAELRALTEKKMARMKTLDRDSSILPVLESRLDLLDLVLNPKHDE